MGKLGGGIPWHCEQANGQYYKLVVKWQRGFVLAESADIDCS